MDYKKMTAACGRDCFNCFFYLATKDENYKMALSKKLGLEPDKVTCKGCREIEGQCQALKNYGFSGDCKIYKCVQKNKVTFCYECNNFPCDLLQPLADRGDKFPHNLKVFNLCMIQKMGLENWAKHESKRIFDRYYNDNLNSCV